MLVYHPRGAYTFAGDGTPVPPSKDYTPDLDRIITNTSVLSDILNKLDNLPADVTVDFSPLIEQIAEIKVQLANNFNAAQELRSTTNQNLSLLAELSDSIGRTLANIPIELKQKMQELKDTELVKLDEKTAELIAAFDRTITGLGLNKDFFEKEFNETQEAIARQTRVNEGIAETLAAKVTKIDRKEKTADIRNAPLSFVIPAGAIEIDFVWINLSMEEAKSLDNTKISYTVATKGEVYEYYGNGEYKAPKFELPGSKLNEYETHIIAFPESLNQIAKVVAIYPEGKGQPIEIQASRSDSPEEDLLTPPSDTQPDVPV